MRAKCKMERHFSLPKPTKFSAYIQNFPWKCKK